MPTDQTQIKTLRVSASPLVFHPIHTLLFTLFAILATGAVLYAALMAALYVNQEGCFLPATAGTGLRA